MKNKKDINAFKDLLKKKVENNVLSEVFKNHPKILVSLKEMIDSDYSLESVLEDILKAYLVIVECFEEGGKLLICGNGGSMSDAQHISSELIKSFRKERPLTNNEKDKFMDLPDVDKVIKKLEFGIPAIALGTNQSLFSAISNDIGCEYTFAQELFAIGKRGDIFLGISTSGNSTDVIIAAQVAKAIGLYSIGLTGESGGRLRDTVETIIKVPARRTDKVQELHRYIYHTLCGMIEDHFLKRK